MNRHQRRAAAARNRTTPCKMCKGTGRTTKTNGRSEVIEIDCPCVSLNTVKAPAA